MTIATASTPLLAPQRYYAARRMTRHLALSHYENFTVVSLAVPRGLRQDFYNIYAFCRHADDLADELPDPQQSLAQLEAFRSDLMRVYESTPRHPILVALSDTVRRHEIPMDPFLALIDAFEQDQRVNRYATYSQLLDYCRRSANPVGHLVLYLCGYRDRRRQELADFTCTALQLTNFWQDVIPDLGKGRVYIPQEDLERFGVREADIRSRQLTPAFTELMKFQVDRAEALFVAGQRLLPLVRQPLRTDIALYGKGGQAILRRIRAIGYDVLNRRPTLGRLGKLLLFARLMLRM